jgi:hypothetical protein
MSSLVRRMAIRLMKRAGYTRNKWIITKDAKGNKYPQPVARDGEITDRDDNPIGRDWPARIPADAIPTPRERKIVKRPARGSRRGKRNKTYIERRKAIA